MKKIIDFKFFTGFMTCLVAAIVIGATMSSIMIDGNGYCSQAICFLQQIRLANGLYLISNGIAEYDADYGVNIDGATIKDGAYYGDGSHLTGVSGLPSQTGNSGKHLTTNGSAASWGLEAVTTATANTIVQRDINASITADSFYGTFRGTGTEWTLVERKTFSASATSYTFSGLNGDVDRRYKMVVRFISSQSEAKQILLRFNGDSGSNYHVLYVGGAHGDVDNLTGVSAGTVRYTAGSVFSETLIDAISGIDRSVITQQVEKSGASVIENSSIQFWVWKNSADNITSIVADATATDAIQTGSYIELWKLNQ